MGSRGKQVGIMDEEPQVRGCYKITFIRTATNGGGDSSVVRAPDS